MEMALKVEVSLSLKDSFPIQSLKLVKNAFSNKIVLDNELQRRQEQRVYRGHEYCGTVGDEDEDVFGVEGPAVAVNSCLN